MHDDVKTLDNLIIQHETQLKVLERRIENLQNFKPKLNDKTKADVEWVKKLEDEFDAMLKKFNESWGTTKEKVEEL